VLFQLYQAGKITLDQALINADSANNLRIKIKLAGLKVDDDPIPASPKPGASTKAAGLQIKGPSPIR